MHLALSLTLVQRPGGMVMDVKGTGSRFSACSIIKLLFQFIINSIS